MSFPTLGGAEPPETLDVPDSTGGATGPGVAADDTAAEAEPAGCAAIRARRRGVDHGRQQAALGSATGAGAGTTAGAGSTAGAGGCTTAGAGAGSSRPVRGAGATTGAGAGSATGAGAGSIATGA